MANDPTFIGRVFVHGLEGTLAWAATAMLAANNEPQKLTFKDDITRQDSKDKKGERIGTRLYDPNPKITIQAMPCQAPGAGAIATAKTRVVLPDKGSKCVVAGFPPDTAAAEGIINSALWLYLGGAEYEFSPEGEVMLTLPLEKFGSSYTPTVST
jgi:hypothetical protein